MTLIWYLIGIITSSIGLFFIIINLNLLVSGAGFSDFIKFILTNGECLLFWIGIGVLILTYERG